ncbi:MAG: heme-binding protein, partial [Chloroflexi bacterium]|nr:heme-binding protein [Chloroflexota bacterium]
MASLTLADAESVIAGARAKMEEMGVKLTISVVDGRGDLIALARVDGASWRTPYISQGKAVASATW